MATTTESHDAEHYVEFDEYISYQLHRTRSSVRLTDLLTAAVGAAALGIGYLLVFVLFDHWVLPGGFSQGARLALLGLLFAALAGWLAWKLVLPYMRRVNALFAARLIEKSTPGLKSSLLNLVDLEQAGRPVPEEVRRALEKRAAVSLSKVDVDHAVDRRTLMRLSYVLFFTVLLFCLYTVLSPKKPWSSLWRAIAPVSSVPVATRTEIVRVQPGDQEVLARSQVEVTVDLRGEIPERTLLLYTTADRKFVDEPIEMRLVDDVTKQYRAVLNGESGRGILQNMTYRIQAGDAETEDFQLTVISPPSATVESLYYEYPSYMELPPVTQSGGNLDAWEGTKVRLTGRANMPVRTALVRFTDSENLNDKAEEVAGTISDGRRISAEWTLAVRSDGSSPPFYHVQCRNEKGESDPEPILYSVKIRPDQPPEVVLLAPRGDFEMPANGVVPLVIEARDPDFKLRRVKLQIEKDGEELIGPEIFEGSAPAYRGSYDWRLETLNLRAGDVLTFCVEAQDNKQPVANTGRTPRLRIRITDPASRDEVEKQLAQAKERQRDETLTRDEDRPGGDPLAADQRADDDASEKQRDPNEPGEPSQDPQKGKGEKGKAEGDQLAARDDVERDARAQESDQRGEERLDPNDEADDGEALQRIIDRERERRQQEAKEQGEEGTEPQGGGDKEKKTPDGAKDDVPSDERERGKAQDAPSAKKDGAGDADPSRKEPSPDGDQRGKDAKDADPSRPEGQSQKEKGEPQGRKEGAKPKDESKPDSGSPDAKEPSGDGTKEEKRPKEKPAGGKEDSSAQREPTGGEKGKGDDGASAKKSDDASSEPSDGTDDGSPTSPSKDKPPQKDAQAKKSAGKEDEQEQGGSPGKESDADPEGASKDAATKSDDPDAKGADRNAAKKDDARNDAPGVKPKGDEPTDPKGAKSKDPSEPQKDGRSGTRPNDATDPQRGDPADRRDAAPSDAKSGDEPRGDDKESGGKGSPRDKQRPADASKTNDKQQRPDGKQDQSSAKKDAADQSGSKRDTESQGKEGAPDKGDDSQSPPDGAAPQEGKEGDKPQPGQAKEGEGKKSSRSTDQRGAKKPSGEDGDESKGGGKSSSKPSTGEQNKSGEEGGNGESNGESAPGKPEGANATSRGGGGRGTDEETKGGAPGEGPGDAKAGGDEENGGKGSGPGSSSAPDLDEVKQATNLVLRKIEDDLARGEVDQKLLDELGWTEDQLKRFAERLKKSLSRPGDDNSPEAIARRRQFEETLKSLNLESRGTTRSGESIKKRAAEEFGPRRSPPPAEYREYYEAFTRSLSKQATRKGEAAKTPPAAPAGK